MDTEDHKDRRIMEMAVEYRNLMEDIVLQNLDVVMAAKAGVPAIPL